MLPVGRASIVVVKATILGNVPRQRRIGPAMLQTLKLLLLLVKLPRMGKIPWFTAEETKDDVQVLVGMVSVNSKPTRALFDSGASHSL